MRKNDILELEITGMTDDGSGVGKADGFAVFVPYTIIGEAVRVNIIKVNKSYAIGKLIEVINPSPHRTKAMCPEFYKCGGCTLQHMDYEAELEYKHKKVEDCIRRIGGIDTEVQPVVPCADIYRYRNKVQFPVSEAGIGFYRQNSHDVIPVDDCLLQTDSARRVIDAVKAWIKDCKNPAYNEKDGSGILRHIYTREGDGGILLVLVTATETLPGRNRLVELSRSSGVSVAGIVQNINSRRTNTVLGDKNVLIWGKGSTWDKLGSVSFNISPNSFYQVNKAQTLRLYNIAVKLADLSGNEIVWDLYCGIGTIGQFAAKHAKLLIGIEYVPQAVENARENAVKNGIDNAVYYCGAAEELAPIVMRDNPPPDVVFLDPPRKGCDSRLLDTVALCRPKRIVYISCKPSTLARDLKYLHGKGYQTKKIIPVDMFPRTAHVECVVLMSKVQN